MYNVTAMAVETELSEKKVSLKRNWENGWWHSIRSLRVCISAVFFFSFFLLFSFFQCSLLFFCNTETTFCHFIESVNFYLTLGSIDRHDSICIFNAIRFQLNCIKMMPICITMHFDWLGACIPFAMVDAVNVYDLTRHIEMVSRLAPEAFVFHSQLIYTELLLPSYIQYMMVLNLWVRKIRKRNARFFLCHGDNVPNYAQTHQQPKSIAVV